MRTHIFSKEVSRFKGIKKKKKTEETLSGETMNSTIKAAFF